MHTDGPNPRLFGWLHKQISEPVTTPVAIAQRHGLSVRFLEASVLGTESQVTRFVDACMVFAEKLSPQQEKTARETLTLGKILEMASSLEQPTGSLFSINADFFSLTILSPISHAVVLAAGTSAGTLAERGPDDELRLIIQPRKIENLEAIHAGFGPVMRSAMGSLGVQKAPAADTHFLVTTPHDIVSTIAHFIG